MNKEHRVRFNFCWRLCFYKLLWKKVLAISIIMLLRVIFDTHCTKNMIQIWGIGSFIKIVAKERITYVRRKKNTNTKIINKSWKCSRSNILPSDKYKVENMGIWTVTNLTCTIFVKHLIEITVATKINFHRHLFCKIKEETLNQELCFEQKWIRQMELPDILYFPSERYFILFRRMNILWKCV